MFMPKTKAKKIQSRLSKRRYEESLSRPVHLGFLPTTGMIIMLMVSVLFAFLVLNWSSGITPPVLESSAAVSVVPIDENTTAVTILSIEPKGAVIKYLTYNDSRKSGIINSSSNVSIPVKNVGDSGFIQISHGNIEIIAVFNDSTQKLVYRGRV
jgi:hypothetical protein